MGQFDAQLQRIAGRQHFVIARDQLLEIGTPRQIRYRSDIGQIERVFRSVYRLAGSPRTWRQELMAACFAGGKQSVVTFRSAAEIHGLPGGQELREVSSPRYRRARHAGIIPHESRFLSDLDIMYVDEIPVTRVARTICDLGWLVESGELEPTILDRAMHEAIRRSLVDLTRVWREWERLGGAFRLGGKAIQEMLRGFVPPLRVADSTAEIEMLQLLRAAGLPEPTPQHRIWLSETDYVELDFAWPEIKRFAEFNSYKWHGGRDKFMLDNRRLLQLRARNWDGIVFTDDDLDEPGLALLVIEKLVQEGRASLEVQQLSPGDARAQ